MTKTVLWNFENYAGMDDFIDRALAECNHWVNYKMSIDVVLPEGDEFTEDDRAEGLELVRQAVAIRSSVYKWRNHRKDISSQLESEQDPAKAEDLKKELKKTAHRIVAWGFEIAKLRAEFEFFVAAQGIPPRVRGRQPRRDSLTTEDYS